MDSPPTATNVPRLFFLDWLRIIALTVLVFYHVGMYYVTWNFHVKSPLASHALEPWMMLSAPWRMSLLFMVSGAATAYLLKAGATVTWLRQRSRYLLLPLLCGVLLVVPPQAYFEVVQKFHYDGDYLDFLKLYFHRYHNFCQNGKCMILPTWNHLWFLPYLWVYTVLLWLAVKLQPNTLTTMARWADQALVGMGLMVLPVAALLLARVALVERFPTTYALAGDWFNHVQYFGMFLAGAAFAVQPAMWLRLAAWRWVALGAAVVGWALLVGVRPRGVTGHAVIAIFQWCALVAAFGFAQRLLNVDNRWRQHLTQAVFPMYVFHQTFIVLLSQLVLPWQWPPVLEGPALVLATLLLSYAGYQVVRRVAVLRLWFGLRPLPASLLPRHPHVGR